MSLLKLVAPAVALASGAYAQCSTTGTLTLTNSADAAGLASCKTYTGSIAIATDATDISVPVTRITENFVTVPEGMLTSLAAPSLQQVDGQMSVASQASLATLSMPELSQVDMFELSATGPNLLQLNFGNPGLQQVTNLSVTDTFLQSFDGIDLKTAQGVNVASNSLLTDLTMQINNITGTLTIRGNSRGLIVSLPNLASAGIVQVNDCSNVSMPALGTVEQTVSFVDNSFETLALPNLTAVGPGTGGFQVAGSNALTNLTVPKLGRVAGGVVIVNNTKLGGTLSFPVLKLAGSGTFRGSFNSLEIPELDRMQGTLTIQSTEDISSTCSNFQNSNAIGGKVTCNSVASTSASSSSSTSTHNAGFRHSASSETAFGVFGALAALFGLFM